MIQQWVSVDRTVMVTRWADGTMTVAIRGASCDMWGPPIEVHPEDY